MSAPACARRVRILQNHAPALAHARRRRGGGAHAQLFSRARVSSILSLPLSPLLSFSRSSPSPRIINKSDMYTYVHVRPRGEDRDIEVVCVPRGYLRGQ